MAFITNVISHLKAAGHLAKDVHIDPAKAKLIDEALAKSVKSDFDVSQVTAAERNALHESRVAIIDALVKPGVTGIQAQEVLKKAFRDKVVGEFGAGDAGSRLQKNFADVMGDAYKKRAEDAAAMKAGGGVPPRTGGDNPVMDSEAALKRATTEAEAIQRREKGLSDWRSGQDNARNLFLSQTDALRSPDATVRLAAFEQMKAPVVVDGKASDLLGLAGYSARSDAAAEQVRKYLGSDERVNKLKELFPNKPDTEIQALRGKPRTPEEIEAIFKEKPGYDWKVVEDTSRSIGDRQDALIKIDPKHQLTTQEWDAYKSHVKQGVLELQQRDIVSAIDKAKLGNGTVEKADEHFTSLRNIMRDPDYLAKHPLEGKALTAQQTGNPRLAADIEKDLRDGKSIGETEIIALNAKYNRPDKAAIDNLALKAVSKDGKTFLKREEVDEFRAKLAQNGLLTASPAKTRGLNKDNFAEHIRDGRPITEGDFDSLIAKGQTQKRPWTVNVPFGDKMGLNGVEVPKWARNGLIAAGLGYFGFVNLPGGDANDGGVAATLYKGAYTMTGGGFDPFPGSKMSAAAKKDLAETRQAAGAAKREELNAAAAEGERQMYKSVATNERIATDHQVSQALAHRIEAGEIPEDKLNALAQRLAKAPHSDGEAGLSRKDLKALEAAPEVTALDPKVQAKLIGELKMRLE